LFYGTNGKDLTQTFVSHFNLTNFAILYHKSVLKTKDKNTRKIRQFIDLHMPYSAI